VQKTMTVLFSDVRAFTTLVEGMTPEQNIAFINRYLSHMEPALLQHHGFVDSYIGDAIMALFDRRPANALFAATEMLRRLRTLNQERAAEGHSQVNMGIGISTGLLTLGTIGGSNRLKCGVIGDCVNLAARIETTTKSYGVPLLVSGDTVSAIEENSTFSLREVDHVRVVGRRSPVTLYEVFDADPTPLRDAKHATLPLWREALEAYREGSLSVAHEIWEGLQPQLPSDPVLRIRLERCREYLAQPRLGPWEHVYELPSK
jgi:class 3 adenylate cyclase